MGFSEELRIAYHFKKHFSQWFKQTKENRLESLIDQRIIKGILFKGREGLNTKVLKKNSTPPKFKVEILNSFADDKKISAFAKDSVKKAYVLQIIQGRDGNKFDPKADTTRAETAVMLYRALVKLGVIK